ncbi:MAG: DegT/DnrJ/EryC1/StrS family aminotransferase [Bryobacteraceae bacterium]|nr:DegT/DnrJ/EryC1/StrS family aminotransferase [Bryobacteraceae bacterium]
MTQESPVIPYFRYSEICGVDQDRSLSLIAGAIKRGAFILQDELVQFERALAAYVGSRYAVGVANATDGLELAFRAVGLRSGDEVLFASHTMVATAAAIHFAGGVPIPVDIGADHLLDAGRLEAAVTSKTRAICPTQLNGRTGDMDAVLTLAAKYELSVVEDAAQALGSKFRGRYAGTFGAAGVYSFYPAKLLGCLGDGGAVVTDDPAVYGRLLELRDHGRDAEGEVVRWGRNSRLDNIQAAVLAARLEELDSSIATRRALAATYRRNLENIPQVVIPPGPDGPDGDHWDVFQNYEIEAADRDRLRRYLAGHGVGTLLPWGGKPVHQLRRLGFDQNLHRTEELFSRVLMLPMNPSVTDEEVEYVSSLIRSFYR